MSRVLVLCSRPLQRKAEEVARWLQSEVRDLFADDFAVRIYFMSLSTASSAWGREWDYLVEIDLRDGDDPDVVVRSEACAALVGDLLLLGMSPAVLVADAQHRVTVTPDLR